MTKKGFTLIELLIVVAIIGIIVAIAIPNLLAAVQRARQKRTMADMKALATVWESYFVDYAYYYPSGGCAQVQGVDMPDMKLIFSSLAVEIQPTYVSKIPWNDGWGRPFYFYTDVAAAAQSYKIESWGKDGVSDSYCGLTTSFDNDIVIFTGQFLEWPEGPQNSK